MTNNLQSYTKEQCLELAKEFVETDDLLCTSIFRGNILKKEPNTSWDDYNKLEEAEKIKRLANLIYYELPEKDISLAFFRTNATSYNKGLSVQYYGDGIVQLLRKCAKKEGLPEIVGGIKYFFIFRDILGIVKNQKKWIEESTTPNGCNNFYYVSTSMIYNINFVKALEVSDEDLKLRAKAIAKKNKNETEEAIEVQYNELCYARKIAANICEAIKSGIPEMLLIKKPQEWHESSALVAGVGKYKIINNGMIFDQESTWNVDQTKTNLKTIKKDKNGNDEIKYTAYYHYPIAMAQTKIEKECYISLYGRSLIALADYDKDEAKYEEAANTRANALNEAAEARNQSTMRITNEI